ncbi:alpha carbonic anhydrase [Scenedesmus sp. NREL 46B-D3]|nr:alpha carbonic anhydrase [Scenedesmus sp. NREL 46B-D3]
MHCLHKQQLPQQATRAAALHVACPLVRSVVLRATASEIVHVVQHSSVAEELAPQEAAVVNRRRMVMLGCACCSSLMLAGQQSTAKASDGVLFTYGEEAGPLSWGGSCSTGLQQSPINLPSSSAAARACGSQPAPEFRYRRDNRVRVKNTGTTIQVNFEPGNSVSWGGAQLQLLQYHFHTPSEHAWGGQRRAMEAHLVHRERATGRFAVVAVMLQPSSKGSSAQPNPCLAAALAHVPATPQAEAACPSSVNPQQLLPAGAAAGRFVHYTGSLTTPPCSEQVDWLVWEQPLPVADQQVLDFMHFAGGGHTYGHNARPLQQLNGRPLDYNCLAGA